MALLRLNIGLIINLQNPGEHPLCGPNKKLEESGYTYNPSEFINNDIQVSCFGWDSISDDSKSIHFIMSIVREMATCIYQDKKNVFIHCHSGVTRTPVILICYMIYDSNYEVKEIIDKVKKQRENSLQGTAHIKIFEKFKECKMITQISIMPASFSIQILLRKYR